MRHTTPTSYDPIMNQVTGAAAAFVRSLFVLMAGLVLGLLLPTLVTATAEHAFVVAAVTVAVIAATGGGLHRSLMRHRAPLVRHQVRNADEVRVLRTDRPTDRVHHPLRPRAPGLV
jgi:hypothetical protein